MKEFITQSIQLLQELIWPSYCNDGTQIEIDRELFAELKERGFLAKLKNFGQDGLADDIFLEIDKHGAVAAQVAFQAEDGMVEFWEFSGDNLRRLLACKAKILNKEHLTQPGYKGGPVIQIDSAVCYDLGSWETLANQAHWLNAWRGDFSSLTKVRSNRVMLKATDEEWAFIIQQAASKELPLNDYLLNRILKDT